MRPPRSSLKVLVVDDDPVLIDLIPWLLNVLGHTVETATTGELALQRIAAKRPIDAVFIDLRMPDMDGTTLAAAINALPHPPRLIGMSGGEPTGEQALHFHAFLRKPFGIEGLARILEDPALQPPPPSAAASTTSLPLETVILDTVIYQRLTASMPQVQLQELYRRTLAYVRQAAPALDAASDDTRSELAHTLQGSCAMVGAVELAMLAEALGSSQPATVDLSEGSLLESPISYKILRASDRLERILKSLHFE